MIIIARFYRYFVLVTCARLDWTATADQHLLPHSTSSTTLLTVSTRSRSLTGATNRTLPPGSTPRSASSPPEMSIRTETRPRRKETTLCKAERWRGIPTWPNRTIEIDYENEHDILNRTHIFLILAKTFLCEIPTKHSNYIFQ